MALCRRSCVRAKGRQLLALWLVAAAPVSAQQERCGPNEVLVQAVVEQTELVASVAPLSSSIDPSSLSQLQHFRQAWSKPDAVAALDEQRRVRLLRLEKGALSSQMLLEQPQCGAECRLFVLDVNGDGRDDIFVHQERSGRSTAWRALEDGSFEEIAGTAVTGRALGVLYSSYDQQLRMLFSQKPNLVPYYFDEHLRLRKEESVATFIPDLSAAMIRLGSGTATYLYQRNRRGWLGLGIAPWFIAAQRLVDFIPRQFDWFSNHIWSDINGDGKPDLLSFPESSRQIWVGLNRSAGVGGARLLELPLRTTGEPLGPATLLAGGDFTGDGIGDILLYENAKRRYLLGTSMAGRPAAHVSMRFAEGSFTADHAGRFCLPQELAVIEPELLDSELAISTVERFRNRLWLLLAQRSARKGALFSLGRVTEPPYVCYGYTPSAVDGVEGFPVTKWGLQQYGACAATHAIFFTDDIPQPSFRSEHLPAGICCPLPHSDIFSDDSEVLADSRCPPNHLAVGMLAKNPQHLRPSSFLCKKINETRYQLAPPKPAVYWGHGFAGASEQRVRWDQIPPALRYGAYRRDFWQTDLDGCTGMPPGSLFVGFGAGASCAAHLYQELQYRGLPGDPPAGSPVKMYPSCSEVQGIFGPLGACADTVRAKGK